MTTNGPTAPYIKSEEAIIEGIECAFRDHPITGSDNIRSVIPI
jgi:hypothetical protein